MPSAVVSALAGVVFGLALAAPPGPMNAVIAEESVVRGWSSGAAAGMGAFLADFVFFLLALAGVVTVVRDRPLLQAGMVAVGGVLMLYFAYGALQEALGSERFLDAEGDVDARGFQKAFVLALTNPYQIVFWLTLGVGLLDPGTLDVLGQTPYVGDSLAGLVVVQTGSPALIVGFFAGILLWVGGFPATLVAAGRRVDSFAPLVAGLSALVLAGFGVTFLVDGASTLAPLVTDAVALVG
jgi:threonine/homoserine/homoserine lactone efflux protein